MDKNIENRNNTVPLYKQAIKSHPSYDELIIFGRRLVNEIKKTIFKKNEDLKHNNK